MSRIPIVPQRCCWHVRTLADAHQLDEYLQATRIAVDAIGSSLEIDLTPGAALAEQIFALLDRDSDRRNLRIRDRGLRADGSAGSGPRTGRSPLSSGVVASRIPGVERNARRSRHDSPRSGGGREARRRQTSTTIRQPASTRLERLPCQRIGADRPITITGQRRDVLQHGIQLDIMIMRPYASASWILVPIVAVTALVACRRRDRHCDRS